MKASGYNPIRWNCQESGCFNIKCRPKIEVFADCFPGRINFGDVDALVEMKGRFCVLEWKKPGAPLLTAQQISFKALTSQALGNIVFFVSGDAETMEVEGYSVFWAGREIMHVKASLSDLKTRIRGWVDFTKMGATAT